MTTGEKVATIFDGEELKEHNGELKGTFSGYKFSANEDQILLATASKRIYRHSSVANYYIYNIKSKEIKSLSDDGKQRLASFNPAGDKVAFVRENNIFIKDLKSKTESQITSDGAFNDIINGACDWVYEEEFGDDNAFTWSPDGEKIAFLRFDESRVKEFSMTKYTGGMYPEEFNFKYPKVGEDNAIVTVHIYTLGDKKTTKVETGTETDIYFPRIKWTNAPNQLVVFRMNRHQNHLELLLADAKTGSTKLLLEEKSKYYVDIHDNLTFLKNGTQFIWTSEKSGFNHIYLHDMGDKETRVLTQGEFDVTNFYGLDEERNMIFYQAAATNPMERHLYCMDLKKGKTRQLTKGNGQHSAQFSKTFDYFVNNHSSANVPYEFTVKDHKGKVLRTIENNSDLVKKLDKYDISEVEFLTIPTKDAQLNAWMIKPANFDKSTYKILLVGFGNKIISRDFSGASQALNGLASTSSDVSTTLPAG